MGLCYYGNVPRRTAYVVKFTCKNYEDQYLRIDIPSRRLGKKTKEWVHKKDVLLRKKSSAFDRELGEAKVTASRIAMVVKGDTVEYDARAFRLAEGSMLDNLMAMLPGVTLTAKGEIYYNGQYVERLMVNGSNFFNGNPKIALDNLPAYTVDKLRFYHEGPKWEHLIDDKNQYHGKRPLVADVRLKREYAQGWIANFEVGGGSKTSGGWDEIYLARVFGMRYTDHSGIGVYGNINNLSDDQSPGRKGEWKRMNVTQGERTVKKAGVNFNVDGKRTKVNYETTLEAKHEDAVNVTNQTSVTNQGSVRQRIESANVGNSGLTYVKWDNSLSIPTKHTYFSLMPKLEYTHRSTDFQYADEQRTTAAALNDANAVWTDGYTRSQSLLSRGDTWNLDVRASSVLRSPLSGKNLNLSLGVEYKHVDSKKTRFDQLVYADDGSGRMGFKETRRDNLPQEIYHFTVNVSRNLFDVKWKKNTSRVNFIYTYSQTYASGARTRELLQDLSDSTTQNAGTALLPSVTADGMWQIDAANTYHTSELEQRHAPGLEWVGLLGPLYFNTQFTADHHRRNITDLRGGTPRKLTDKDMTYWFIGLVTLGNTGMRLNYIYNQTLPSMLYLLDVRDADDPMSISLGNADLKKSREHTVSLTYGKHKRKLQMSASCGVDFNIVRDALGNARFYDAATGAVTYQPRNIDGNWNGKFYANYSRALDKKKRVTLSANAEYKYTHSVDFASSLSLDDNEKSLVNNHYAGGTLKIDYRTPGGIHVGGRSSVTYHNQYAEAYDYRNHATEYSYGITFTTPLGKHFGFESDVMAYARRGYSEKSLNTTDWVWNASLSYTFGKSKEWLVRAVGFDLLQQLSSVKREVNEQGYIETRYNTIPSYATLHIVYRLSVKPKKKK